MKIDKLKIEKIKYIRYPPAEGTYTTGEKQIEIIVEPTISDVVDKLNELIGYLDETNK